MYIHGMPLFVQKFDEPKKLRSVRLTDSAWNSLARIASERGMTRTDLLEEWVREKSSYNTKQSAVQVRKLMETYIDDIVDRLVPKRPMKVAPVGLVRRCLQELVDQVYPFE